MKLSAPQSTKTLVALAVLAVSTFIATADPVPNYVSGDIFLGVRAESSPGESESYLVKLGNDLSFTSSGALTLGNLGADLVSKYGANWHTRADLHWGVFGVRSALSQTLSVLYASRERTSPSIKADPWIALSNTQRGITASAVRTVILSQSGDVIGYETRTATANSPLATFQPNGPGTPAGAAAYNYQVTSGVLDFGSTSGWESIEGGFSAGASGTALDIFRIAQSNSVTHFGTLTISSSGVITFTLPTVAPVDHDGDGFFDFEEALAGTSDNNGADFFKVQSVTKSPTGVLVSFNSIGSRIYKIYYSENLGSWQLIDTVNGGPYNDTNVVRTARPKGFYKVVVTTP